MSSVHRGEWKRHGNWYTRVDPPYTLYVYLRVDGWHAERHMDGRVGYKGPYKHRAEATCQACTNDDWWDFDCYYDEEE